MRGSTVVHPRVSYFYRFCLRGLGYQTRCPGEENHRVHVPGGLLVLFFRRGCTAI